MAETALFDGTTLELVASAPDAEAVREQLEVAADACPPPWMQLRQAAQDLGVQLPGWRQLQVARRVKVFVTPPGRGAAFARLSLAADSGDLELLVAAPLPESRTCAWARHWAAETLDTLLHEMFHLRRFVDHGPAVDRLQEEVLAYGVGECVQRVLWPDVARQFRFPGLDELTPHSVGEHVQAGRVPPTIAGRWAAYRWWDSVRSGIRPLCAEWPFRTGLSWREVP